MENLQYLKRLFYEVWVGPDTLELNTDTEIARYTTDASMTVTRPVSVFCTSCPALFYRVYAPVQRDRDGYLLPEINLELGSGKGMAEIASAVARLAAKRMFGIKSANVGQTAGSTENQLLAVHPTLNGWALSFTNGVVRYHDTTKLLQADQDTVSDAWIIGHLCGHVRILTEALRASQANSNKADE